MHRHHIISLWYLSVTCYFHFILQAARSLRHTCPGLVRGKEVISFFLIGSTGFSLSRFLLCDELHLVLGEDGLELFFRVQTLRALKGICHRLCKVFRCEIYSLIHITFSEHIAERIAESLQQCLRGFQLTGSLRFLA